MDAMLAARVAGAPISWGVCEVPDWGYQLSPERVLREMSRLGLSATEFGPAGFLPVQPAARAELLRRHRLRAVGGFLPVPLHDARADPMPAVDLFIDDCLACGADVVVLAAASGSQGYDQRAVLDRSGWRTVLSNLDRISERAADRGVLATIHPHVGTAIERADEVDMVLSGSRIPLCLDTGHLVVGGADPVALARDHPERVGHVHLKDVDTAMARRVSDGTLTFGDAVRAGLFRPLGRGDIDIATLVSSLETAGYRGWYVLEQDVMLGMEPAGEGPLADVRVSLAYLMNVGQ